MNYKTLRAALIVTLLLTSAYSFAGGPLIVGGPAVGSRAAFGIDGKPFTWNPAQMPIQYRVDPGPMAVTSTGSVVISNSAGLQRLQSMFAIWQGVSTAAVSFTNAGALLPTGSYSGGDLKTLQQYNDVVGSCKAGSQNPVVFDADGSLMSALGLPPEVIGFTSTCKLDTVNGYITGALIALNGKFQDGLSQPTNATPNYELSANEFDEAMTHEIGHLLGLDHSQINLDIFTEQLTNCPLDDLAGLPLMFPVEFCQARKDAGLPVLAPDDIAWISKLYPNAAQVAQYGTISGYILFSDGVSQFQGANVIVRAVDDPKTLQDESRRVAVSVVSGYLFTGNPGQNITADMSDPKEHNTEGDPTGSRNPQLIGYYEVPVPPGTYTVEVEAVYPNFKSDSGLGPLNPPVALSGQPEFWNKDESPYDFPLQRDTITVHAGDKITNTNIILNSTTTRYDQYEDDGMLIDPPVPASPFLAGGELA